MKSADTMQLMMKQLVEQLPPIAEPLLHERDRRVRP